MKEPMNNHSLKFTHRNNKNIKDQIKQSNLNSFQSLNTQNHDDLNNTFFIKDYDTFNPYLNKDSLNRGRLTNRSKHIQDSITLEYSLLSDSSLGNHQLEIQSHLKLPKLNNKNVDKVQNSKKMSLPKLINRNFNQNSQKSTQNSKQMNLEKQQNHKNSILRTRIETDDFSILQNGSSSSLLKLSKQSLNLQPLSAMKISKITNSQNLQLYSHRNFLRSQNLISQQNQSELISLTALSSTRKPYQTILEEQSTTSQSDDQYINDSVPGPGYYSISHHSSFSKPQTKRRYNNKNYDFGSKQSRFQINKNSLDQDSLSQLKLQEYQQKQRKREQRLLSLNKKQKKIVPFNSKEQNIKQNPQNSLIQKMISPVYYNPRSGIQQDLIKKIQRNFKGKFGSEQKRFKTLYRKPYNLGPGSYSVDLKNEQQECNRVAHYFSSRKPRFQ